MKVLKIVIEFLVLGILWRGNFKVLCSIFSSIFSSLKKKGGEIFKKIVVEKKFYLGSSINFFRQEAKKGSLR